MGLAMTAGLGDDTSADKDADARHFRRPIEADHPGIVERLDDWWGGRHVHELLPRLWFQHFLGTSWIVEDDRGAPIGFLVGFISPDHPEVAHIHMVGVSPNHRRAGIASALYRRFIDDVEERGVRHVRAVTWPGNRISVAFHRSLGFEPVAGPGSQRLYGTVAYADYDHHGADRVLLALELPQAGDD